MKIIKQLLLLCVFLLVIFFFFCVIVISKYTYFSEDAQKSLIKGYTQSEIDYIYVDDIDKTNLSIEKISTYIGGLDNDLTHNFFSDGWKIVLGENVLCDYSEGYAGVTIWESRTILLNSYDDPEIEYRVFIHEFGHYFDLANGFLSSSSEFKKLYTLYKDSYTELDELIPDKYPRSTPQEFFASCFKEYYYCPEHLRSIAPLAYDFLNNHIKAASSPFSECEAAKRNFIGGLSLMKNNIQDTINKWKSELKNE